jgi:ABC-2 type transport system permease protein
MLTFGTPMKGAKQLKTFSTLLKTELKLTLKGMDMFIFAICVPVIITAILGMIYGNKPAFEGASYTFFAQSFGAMSTIAVCAGGVMGIPLLVSDYRNKKILKRFKVTPISPGMILAVIVMVYVLYSIASLVLVYAISAVFFGYRMAGGWAYFLSGYLLVMLSLFSIGMMVGGVSPNMKMASTIASLLFFPMFILSGATLPYEVMPKVLQNVANVMPLTQGIKILKAASLGLPLDGVLNSVLIISVLAIACIFISIKFFKWE